MSIFAPPWGESPVGLQDRLALGLSRLGRWVRDLGVPLPPRARLIYHPRYLDFPRESGGRHSFDVRRPARILEQLSRLGVLSQRAQVLAPRQIARSELELIHPASYLASLELPGRLADLLKVQAVQGEEGRPVLLEPFLWQTGGTLLAAELALRDRIPVVNLGGGFHHAQRDRTEGFCPINDLAVAIAVLREHQGIERVLVIDLDYHQGAGTTSIFAEDDNVFTVSVHGQSWSEQSGARANIDVELAQAVTDQDYLHVVQEALNEALSRFSPQLALYVAGADPCRRDTFGNSGVSEDALLTRDVMVWRRLTAARVPLAVVLGGGYGPLAWSIPFNFIFTLLTGRPPDVRLRPSNIAARYQRVHRRLRPSDLGSESDELIDDELWAQLDGKGVTGGRYLGYYTRDGIALALERYGFMDLLREKGFDDFLISLDTSQGERHVMRLHHRQRDPEHLLIEVASCLRPLFLPDGHECRMLRIEWLLMQNPDASFSFEQPPLPGQDYPGLGLFRWFGEILRLVAVRLECDGLMNQPERYHNGHLYGKVMKFFHPEDEGVLQALVRDLEHLTLAEASAAIDAGKVIDRQTGEPQLWQMRAQVLPITLPLATYFKSPEYAREVERARDSRHFELRDDSSAGDGQDEAKGQAES